MPDHHPALLAAAERPQPFLKLEAAQDKLRSWSEGVVKLRELCGEQIAVYHG